MAGIEVKNITKRSPDNNGRKELIFENFNLTVRASEIVGIMGPNGCGKTTLFNMIAGLMKPDSGEIKIFGKRPEKHNIAYIFQDYRHSLFPWMTVKNNIIFPLTVKGESKKVINDRLEYISDLVGFPFDINKYPYQLSGGQQQYVTILRGLAAKARVMLIDEPFSALDYNNAFWLRNKLLEVLEIVKIPTIFVAHDIDHLIYLTNRILLLSAKPTKVIKEISINTERPMIDSPYDKVEHQLIKNEIMDLFISKELSFSYV